MRRASSRRPRSRADDVVVIVDQLPPDRLCRGFRDARAVELLPRVLQVELHDAGRYVQAAGDLLGVPSLDDQRQALGFARRQADLPVALPMAGEFDGAIVNEVRDDLKFAHVMHALLQPVGFGRVGCHGKQCAFAGRPANGKGHPPAADAVLVGVLEEALGLRRLAIDFGPVERQESVSAAAYDRVYPDVIVFDVAPDSWIVMGKKNDRIGAIGQRNRNCVIDDGGQAVGLTKRGQHSRQAGDFGGVPQLRQQAFELMCFHVMPPLKMRSFFQSQLVREYQDRYSDTFGNGRPCTASENPAS